MISIVCTVWQMAHRAVAAEVEVTLIKMLSRKMATVRRAVKVHQALKLWSQIHATVQTAHRMQKKLVSGRTLNRLVRTSVSHSILFDIAEEESKNQKDSSSSSSLEEEDSDDSDHDEEDDDEAEDEVSRVVRSCIQINIGITTCQLAQIKTSELALRFWFGLMSIAKR